MTSGVLRYETRSVKIFMVTGAGPISRPEEVDLFILMPPSVGGMPGHYDFLCLHIRWPMGG